MKTKDEIKLWLLAQPRDVLGGFEALRGLIVAVQIDLGVILTRASREAGGVEQRTNKPTALRAEKIFAHQFE